MPREKIKLQSTGKTKAGKRTGTFKTTTKDKRANPEKLVLRCFDRLAYNSETGTCGMHVLFEETKI